MKRSSMLALGLILAVVSCKVEPQAINYGEDTCHFCWMTIVDRSHATEVVTSKGKAFKFDSIECLMNFIKDGEEEDIALYLVNDLFGDGSLIDAETATYLKCDQIPSPMGGYLSAFEEKSRAQDVHREMGGSLYTWSELHTSFAGIMEDSSP